MATPALIAARVGAAGGGRSLLWVVLGVFAIPLAILLLIAALVAGIGGSFEASQNAAPVTQFAPSAFAQRDIPAAYLDTYEQAAGAYGLDWAYLAAIGKIETDHGRLRAAGVTSGVNSVGCCAGPMQFSVIGSGGGTWGSYGVDGNHDGRRDVYDHKDAIPGAAKYLRASGAPEDWNRAIFAYNHASWYVAKVKQMADRYRGRALAAPGSPAGSATSQTLPPGAHWLEHVPGTAALCDRRIVTDVQYILKRYKASPGDCFSISGHASAGEHPLGLAIDLHPADGGDWPLLGQAARDFGWRESCAATGCAGQIPSPFRFIGWNGYPNHGDPAHAGANAHLHLSWQHTPAAPGTPAATVQTLLAPLASAGAPPSSRPPSQPHALLNLGDSLAVGVDAPLASALTGWNVRTEAAIGRATQAGLDRLRRLAAGGPLPHVLAVSLGTNDSPTQRAAFAALIRSTLQIAGPDRCVLWLSIDRPPQDGQSYDALNTELDAAARAHPQLHVLDGSFGERAPDRIHKTPAGYEARARLIARAARSCDP